MDWWHNYVWYDAWWLSKIHVFHDRPLLALLKRLQQMIGGAINDIGLS
jgi:hypothetical protein